MSPTTVTTATNQLINLARASGPDRMAAYQIWFTRICPERVMSTYLTVEELNCDQICAGSGGFLGAEPGSDESGGR